MGLLLWLQVKRIHEYKRQLLNVLGIIWKYDQIKKMSPDQRSQVPLLHPNLMFLSSGNKIQHISRLGFLALHAQDVDSDMRASAGGATRVCDWRQGSPRI